MMNSVTESFTIRPAENLLETHPQLRRLSSDLALKYAHNTLVTDTDLQTMGSQLWQALDCDQAYRDASANAGLQICPVVIESDLPAIQQLPWETLYHPEHGFLGLEPGFALSRHLPGVPHPQVSPETGPLRVLLFTAMTEDQARLDVENEQAQVQEALIPLINKGLVTLEMPNDGRFATFRRYLQKQRPHLVFLSGHGRFHDHTLNAGQNEDYATFAFEAANCAHSDEISGAELAKAFIGTAVQCVVLSACQSGMSASDQLSAGLMQQLALRGVAHVIGMRESILDSAGTRLVRALCDHICQRQRVDVALQQARQAITRPLAGVRRDSDAGDGSGMEELSLGQWCLPMLISQNPARALIDWDFTPEPPRYSQQRQTLHHISLPDQFIGRRRELCKLEAKLLNQRQRQLLITGPGGQGKTALAGHLAQRLQQAGWLILDWSARPDNRWRDFLQFAEEQLTEANRDRYNRSLARHRDETARAGLLLEQLAQQSGNRLLLFFDNLESVQDPETRALNEDKTRGWLDKLAWRLRPDKPRFGAWIAAARQTPGVTLLLTSRWKLPGWAEEHHLPLEHCSYNDYLALARRQPRLRGLLEDRDKLRRVHQALHGNPRALGFFADALGDMTHDEEASFLRALAQASAESQADMALEFLIDHRSPSERALLERLQAYAAPVPVEGIVKLALTGNPLPQPRQLLEALIAVSLVERHWAEDLHTFEYQCPTQVREWLQAHSETPPTRPLFQAAADYQRYLLGRERSTLTQAIVTHHALQLAGDQQAAERLALYIVDVLSLDGLYDTVLEKWLPEICESNNRKTKAEALGLTGKQHLHLGGYDTALKFLQQSLAIQQEIGDKSGEGATLNNISQIYDARGDYETALKFLQQSLAIRQEIGDKSGEGTTLNNISQIYDARGDYETALKFLQQSLAIQQEIGDTAGLCATLFNMGHIHLQNGQMEEAIGAWVSVHRLAKPMQLSEALEALAGLADSLGIPGGLEGWEMLARTMAGDD